MTVKKQKNSLLSLRKKIKENPDITILVSFLILLVTAAILFIVQAYFDNIKLVKSKEAYHQQVIKHNKSLVNTLSNNNTVSLICKKEILYSKTYDLVKIDTELKIAPRHSIGEIDRYYSLVNCDIYNNLTMDHKKEKKIAMEVAYDNEISELRTILSKQSIELIQLREHNNKLSDLNKYLQQEIDTYSKVVKSLRKKNSEYLVFQYRYKELERFLEYVVNDKITSEKITSYIDTVSKKKIKQEQTKNITKKEKPLKERMFEKRAIMVDGKKIDPVLEIKKLIVLLQVIDGTDTFLSKIKPIDLELSLREQEQTFTKELFQKRYNALKNVVDIKLSHNLKISGNPHLLKAKVDKFLAYGNPFTKKG